jgi:hypothetical protein
MKDPEFREFSKFRHVLMVAQKDRETPSVAVARHFALYETLPSINDAIHLKTEVLDDEDVRSHINFEGNPSYPDLVVVLLAGFSEAFVHGILGPLVDEKNENQQ